LPLILTQADSYDEKGKEEEYGRINEDWQMMLKYIVHE
jgi:hypothetical protein